MPLSSFRLGQLIGEGVQLGAGVQVAARVEDFRAVWRERKNCEFMKVFSNFLPTVYLMYAAREGCM